MSRRFIQSMIARRSSSTDRSMPLRADERLAQELDHRDAGDLLRVLEREEHAALRTDVSRPVGDVVALEPDAAAGHLVPGAARSAFARVDLPDPFGP